MKGNPPLEVIRDANLKATLWENKGEKGPYITTSFAKTYRDKSGNLHDTSIFNNNDLLRISELARQAYGRSNELRRELLNSQSPDQNHAQTNEPELESDFEQDH